MVYSETLIGNCRTYSRSHRRFTDRSTASVSPAHISKPSPDCQGTVGLPGTNPEPESAEIPRWLPLHSICCSQVLCSVPAINKDTRGKRESRPKGSGDNTQESGLNTREKHRSHKMGLTNTAVSEGKNEG